MGEFRSPSAAGPIAIGMPQAQQEVKKDIRGMEEFRRERKTDLFLF